MPPNSSRKTRDGREELVAYLVRRQPERNLTGKNVKSAYASRDPVSNRPEILFRLDDEGAKNFAQITRENIGRQLAIVLDGELYSAPTIQGEIPSGSGQITGNFDIKEAIELANVLENPLEAPVKIEQQLVVDPSLGKDSIRSGITAAIIGTLAVSVFMLVYYMLSGMIANVALIANIIILVGVMCSVDTTFNTLAGANGFLQTMALQPDGRLVIGGDFTSAGAIPANGVAKWDGSTWSALGAGVDGVVTCAISADGEDEPPKMDDPVSQPPRPSATSATKPNDLSPRRQ